MKMKGQSKNTKHLKIDDQILLRKKLLSHVWVTVKFPVLGNSELLSLYNAIFSVQRNGQCYQ